MLRSRTILVIAGLALVASAAGGAAHFYGGLSRTDAGWLMVCAVALAVLYAVTLPWRRPRKAPRPRPAEPQAPSTAVLAYRMAELERRVAALEVQVAAASLDAASSEPAQQDPVLRARARAELALAAAAIERQ
jgi:hypothetical protein